MTRVEVELDGGRHRLRTREGLLRAQRLHGSDDCCRVGLLATTGLLLGGDAVVIEIVVGPGARLKLYDVAGTVAYHGRGRRASWRVEVCVAAGGELHYLGEPFVVTEGADVRRDLTVDLAAGARLVLRDTVVLGRSGERGGELTGRTCIRREGRTLLLEELRLGCDSHGWPGLLGSNRVIDALLSVGVDPPILGAPADVFTLLDPDASLTRFLGADLAASPLQTSGALPP